MYTVIVSLLHACEAELRWDADRHGAVVIAVENEPDQFGIVSDSADAVMAAINGVLEVNEITARLSALPYNGVVMLSI